MSNPTAEPMTAERIERALLALAVIIASRSEKDAGTLAPIYDRLERELAAYQERRDVVSRAHQRIERYRKFATPQLT